MGGGGRRAPLAAAVLWLVGVSLVLLLLPRTTTANVVLIGKNVSLSFDDVEANFAPAIKSSGICGNLYVSEPLDACSPLTNKLNDSQNPPFALIIRGGCTFDEKVRTAQKAGFKAAIIYDDDDDGALVAMAGSSTGIKIYSVFISKASGEVLKKYAGLPGIDLWILPTFENSAWSIMAISFISLLAISAVLATCFFVRRHRIRRERPRPSRVREFHGMSSRLVKAMPSLIFTTVLEDNCTSMTCAICLEDYSVGEKLRILPCRHKFHALCVDSWLTSWRTFCPVCKRDARTNIDEPPASENTPLLSSAASSPASSFRSVSFHSSAAASPAIRILPSPSRSSMLSRPHSLASTAHTPTNLRSFHNSPSVHASRSQADLRNMSSQRSHLSYLLSSHSLGVGLPSPSVNSRFASPYVRHSGNNGSPSYLVGSSSRQSFLRYSESGTSLSQLASAQSLPGVDP